MMPSLCLEPHAVQLTPPDIARWKSGNAGAPYVYSFDSGLPGPQVLVTALVHGNEISGAMVLNDLLQQGVQVRSGNLTLAFCNVAAFSQFDPLRPDASRYLDEDFNRVWSNDRLYGSTSNREVERARQLLPFVQRCTHLLDLHSMHEPCEPLWVTGLLPRNIALAQSLQTGAQTVVDAGHADGVRMRDFAQLSSPTEDAVALLLEAGQHWQLSTLNHARNALARFLLSSQTWELSDIPIGWLMPKVANNPPIEVTHKVVARSMNFTFTESFQGGEVIAQAGTVIGYDQDEPIVTPYSECVLVMPSLRQLRAGVTVVRLGRYY